MQSDLSVHNSYHTAQKIADVEGSHLAGTHKLSDEHKAYRVATTLEFLIQYKREGEPLLARVVKSDKIWVRNQSSKTKLLKSEAG